MKNDTECPSHRGAFGIHLHRRLAALVALDDARVVHTHPEDARVEPFQIGGAPQSEHQRRHVGMRARPRCPARTSRDRPAARRSRGRGSTGCGPVVVELGDALCEKLMRHGGQRLHPHFWTDVTRLRPPRLPHVEPTRWAGVPLSDRRIERRALLIGAAFELFGDEGESAVSVRSVCRRSALNSRYLRELRRHRRTARLRVRRGGPRA